MTISHRGTRSRSSNSSDARVATVSNQNQPVDPPEQQEEREEGYLRGSAKLPPIIPNIQDHPLIEPEGKSHWTNVTGRAPSSVLTCLLKHYYPGLVHYRGKTVPASTWKHYKAAMDTSGRSVADIVEGGFWQRFRFNPAKEHESRKHIGQCCSDLLRSMLYYARITATMEHFRLVVGRKICDKIAGQFYLTREEYINQRITWFKQDCWDALATEWSSAKFRESSEKNRSNRYNDNFKPHKGGSNSIAVIRQKLSIKLGRPVSDIEAWIHTHRGSNPDDVTSLNTREATVCLEKYKSKAIELNGPDFDWLHSPIDVRALYQCDCGRRHGKWATFNGIINDSETLPELKRSRASANAAQRQHREEEQRIRKEAQDSRLAKDYAQQLLEWGRNVQTQNESIQAFMERVAEHTGMAITTVPSLLPPPPPPPIYAASPSPNPSPDNVGTFQSSVGIESPEETISRIANGVFRGHVNATTSGGGTYSPIANDDFPLYD